jgi:hypothetical protein
MVKDWAKNASPITSEPIRKLLITRRIEIIFNIGNILRGILAFASGWGANRIMMIRLIRLITRSIGEEMKDICGIRTNKRVETILHPQTDLICKPPDVNLRIIKLHKVTAVGPSLSVTNPIKSDMTMINVVFSKIAKEYCITSIE